MRANGHQNRIFSLTFNLKDHIYESQLRSHAIAESDVKGERSMKNATKKAAKKKAAPKKKGK